MLRVIVHFFRLMMITIRLAQHKSIGFRRQKKLIVILLTSRNIYMVIVQNESNYIPIYVALGMTQYQPVAVAISDIQKQREIRICSIIHYTVQYVCVLKNCIKKYLVVVSFLMRIFVTIIVAFFKSLGWLKDKKCCPQTRSARRWIIEMDH